MNAVRCLLNDRPTLVTAPAGRSVLSWLREGRQLTGTREGCAEGECGACAVLLGEPVNGDLHYRAVASCLLPVGELAGRHLVTVEGLSPREGLNAIQQALVDVGAPQCGFCFSGFVVALAGYFLTTTEMTAAGALAAIDGNICRCTGYASIRRAIAGLCDAFGPELATDGPRVPQLVALDVLPAHFGDAAAQVAALQPTAEAGTDGRPVGGATDLLVQRGRRLAHDTVALTSRRPELRALVKADGGLVIGGAVTIAELAESPLVADILPVVHEMASRFGSTLIRNQATVAGNIVNGSPIADLVMVLLAADAEVELVALDGGRRRVPLDAFYLGYKELDLAAGELARAVRVPLPAPGAAFSFERVSRRRLLDIASVTSCAMLRREDGVVRAARLAIGGVAPVPLLARNAAAALVGRPADAAAVQAATAALDAEIAPIDDVRGSAAYKALLARRLLMAHLLKLAPDAVQFAELL